MSRIVGSKKLWTDWACMLLCMVVVTAHTTAAEFESNVEEFQDNTSAATGASKKLLKEDARLVPVVIPIVNPTIGTGLGGGLIYMHPGSSEERDAPTTMTGAIGMYTDSKSWAAGGFHDGYYLDDRIRFRVPVVHGEFHVDYYGIGQNSPFRDNPVKYVGVGNLFIPRISFELPWDNWFLGGQYRLIDVDTSFDQDDILPEDEGLDTRRQTAGLGFVSLFDSRDSNLWPTRGSWLDFTAIFNGAYVGGDYEYTKAIAKWAQYFPLTKALGLVYRLDGQYIGGTAPFWDLSRLRLRGYSSGQFLDKVALTAQAEVRWNVYRRWTVLAFAGGGRIADEFNEIGAADNNIAGGGGVRYMLVEKQKLAIGIDVAYSEAEEVSIYFQVGDWLAN